MNQNKDKKDQEMSVLLINRSDNRGGAGMVAWSLFEYYLSHGVKAWYAVQHKLSRHNNVLTIDNELHYNFWKKFILGVRHAFVGNRIATGGLWKVARILEWIAGPGGEIRKELGVEEFNYPGSAKILSRVPVKPDVIHGHVLHGGFFDLRLLSEWSQKIPVMVTLHDAWMLSGHCAHSFDCTRWKTGCGECPDLTIPIPIKRDSSAYNWRRKYGIYHNSKLFIATPCHWLMKKVHESSLMSGTMRTRVIPNGVDHGIFFPADRRAARKKMGVDEGVFVFLFSANGIRRNRWKDFGLMRTALETLSTKTNGKQVLFVALGEEGPGERLGDSEIRFLPYQQDPSEVASCYNAADVYLHASKADTFPTSVLEALSCGIPVIGTDVGGIPEQINGLGSYPLIEATGLLVKSGDAGLFAEAMLTLLENDELRRTLGDNAARDAAKRFSLVRQANEYLAWYQEIIQINKENTV